MLGEALIRFVTGFVRLIVGFIPSTDPPSWLDDGSGFLVSAVSAAYGLGAWLPWNLMGTVIVAVIASAGLGLGIKIVRIVASFLTVGGGSAG